jgi:hypothetical protein
LGPTRGKGNFAVVTAMVCQLFPQTRFYGGEGVVALEHIPAVVPAWRDWTETLPEQATSSIAVQRLPALPALPEVLRGASVVHLRFTHLGSAAEGEQLFAPMRAIAPTMLDTVGELPCTSIDLVHLDPAEPMPYWDRTMMLHELPTQALEAFVALTGPDSDCPLITVEIRRLGGAMDREPAVPTPCLPGHSVRLVRRWRGRPRAGRRDAHLPRQGHGRNAALVGQSPDAQLPIRRRSHHTGTGQHRLRRTALPAPSRDQETYDPLNTFRINHNITPA